MKVLLHTCCGPCASACIARLKDAGHDVTLFYSNSNINTADEFARRRAAAETLAAADKVPLLVDDYDHAAWLARAAAGFEREPEKGARCARCFHFNLARTAAVAASRGFDAFTTSLSVSPHKASPVIFTAGRAAADAAGAKFLEEDFKKREGFKLSARRAAELGLYRQSYCGCEFSRR